MPGPLPTLYGGVPFHPGVGMANPANPAIPPVDPNAQAGMGAGVDDPAYGSFAQPFDVEEFYKYQDPGYWFRKQQGEQAVQNSAAAGSGALSGTALKDLMSFNSGLASEEYGNAFNRYQTQQGNIYQRLFGIANLGQNAAAGSGAQGTALAGNAGANIANAGAATGAGYVGAGNALAGGGSNYWLSQLMQQGGGGYSGAPRAGPTI